LKGKPRILVAPLDWGLGHATRCIPIIRELIDQGADPILAGEGLQRELLTSEFPTLPFINLPGYRIRYSSTASRLPWKLLLQLGQIRRAIKQEYSWLKEQVANHLIDAVISDNRFGLYTPSIPAVFITHQLQISTGGRGWEQFIRKRNYAYINRFSECWVPDNEKEPSLASALSHPAVYPKIPVHYIGALSRFSDQAKAERQDHIAVLISGPEPQRSIFETIAINELSHYDGHATLVRGLPGAQTIIPSTNMISCHNHLSATELQPILSEAEFIIARSGYSTVMDAATLKKKCIFIPTPGQTEQQYLAKELFRHGMAFYCNQNDFNLREAILKARSHDFRLVCESNSLLPSAIKRLIAAVKGT
jgi:UDP-N-acetylglucosamine transferase subunit ALG13